MPLMNAYETNEAEGALLLGCLPPAMLQNVYLFFRSTRHVHPLALRILHRASVPSVVLR